ncbi:MAG: hypothetical protein L3J88_08710 [Gammaproteobacteria bacterium]|nr:hypothetical protein [Gammaproteobacteria bacterium]MCF6363409.1 hypothetical protein [Gammaproteobacteria bacterium]
MVNYLVFLSPITFFHGPDAGLVQDVELIVSEAASPAGLPQTYWQPLSLPDDWYKNQRQVGQVWYRANVSLGEPGDNIWAVYLPLVAHNAAVFINGVWVGQGGPFGKPTSRHQNNPLLFSFSPLLLQPGENRIDIRVQASFHEQGYLDGFYLAPESRLKDVHAWKHFVRVDLIRWMTMAMYLMSAIVFAFWLARPQDSIYGLFSLELFLWATHNLNLFVSEIPVSARLWEAMIMSTLGWTVIVMIFFNHRYVGERNAGIEKFILVFAVLGIGIFFLPDIGSILHIGYGVWDSFLMVFGCYAIFYLLRAYVRRQDPDIFLMLLVGVPILVFGFHDILIVNHFLDRRDGLIMHYSAIPAALLFSWFLIRRFVQSINRAEHLADTLDRRVRMKQRELQSQYEKFQSVQEEGLLLKERERIMRDMHDGIGGQLVSVISLLQEQSGDVHKKVREKIQHSLTDLRLVIDSLDPLLNDLPTLLGMMRMRLVDQLEAANITLEWAVTELPEMKNMSPRRSLHIMRIVQESIANSIKHAQSEKMMLATGVIGAENRQVYVDVIDYGIGIAGGLDAVNRQGRGIKNMQYRAQQLGAILNIDSAAGGTRVRLLMDVE